MTNQNETKIDELFSELIDELFKPKEAAQVDPLEAFNRVMKKAEGAADKGADADVYLRIADRYSRIVESALVFQNK